VGSGEAVMLKNQRRHNTVTSEQSGTLGSEQVADLFRKFGSGGRDRTADLGVMNHYPGKNLIFAFDMVAATRNFSDIYYPSPIFPVL